MLVASAPEVPGVATHDFLRRKTNPAIHRFENVGSDLRKIGRAFSRGFGFVDRLVLLAADKRKQNANTDARSDSSETEKMTHRFQQYLHRAIIDTVLVNRVARKFWKTTNNDLIANRVRSRVSLQWFPEIAGNC